MKSSDYKSLTHASKKKKSTTKRDVNAKELAKVTKKTRMKQENVFQVVQWELDVGDSNKWTPSGGGPHPCACEGEHSSKHIPCYSSVVMATSLLLLLLKHDDECSTLFSSPCYTNKLNAKYLYTVIRT